MVVRSSIMALNSLQHSLSLRHHRIQNHTTTMAFYIAVAIIHKCLSQLLFFFPFATIFVYVQLFNRKSLTDCYCVLYRSLELLSLIKLIVCVCERAFFHLRFQRVCHFCSECAILNLLADFFYFCSAGPFPFVLWNKNITVIFDEYVVKRWKIHSSDSITILRSSINIFSLLFRLFFFQI